jgi:primary-amine oxidase
MRKKTSWLQFLGITFLVVMIAVVLTTRTLAQPPQITHPLDPLTTQEINTAVSVLKKEKSLSDRATFPNLSLREPDKSKVLAFKKGDPITREAFVVVLDPGKNKAYEAIVDLQKASLLSWQEVTD